MANWHGSGGDGTVVKDGAMVGDGTLSEIYTGGTPTLAR